MFIYASHKKDVIYYVGSFVIDQQMYVYWCLSILIVFYILMVAEEKEFVLMTEHLLYLCSSLKS